MSAKIIFRIFKNIEEVPCKLWDTFANKSSAVYSTKYWKLIEHSKITGFYNFNYIMFFIGEKPVGIAACYFFDVDLIPYMNKNLKTIIKLSRKFFPKCLIANNLECGTPINIHTPPFVIDPDISAADILCHLEKALNKIAGENKTLLISIKDLNKKLINNKLFCSQLNKKKYLIINSTPGSYININWNSICEYLENMKSYYRSKLNNHLRKNKKRNISYKLVDDFSNLSNDLFKQWFTVYTNAGEFQREILNSEFYYTLSDRFAGQSKALLFYSDKKLIGHAILLIDKDILRWLYIGKEKSLNDSLYIYIMYKVIEAGIHLGVNKIDCGPTTYSVKQDLGAEIEPLYYALKFKNPILNYFGSCFLKKLNNVNIPKQKNIFKG